MAPKGSPDGLIRSLQVRDGYRVLPPGFGSGVELGKTTVVYGHNGSGKTTLAELLLHAGGENAFPNDTSPVDLDIVNGQTTQTNSSLHVFTSEWVAENIEQFLDGDDGPAIVTIGKAATDNEKEQRRISKAMSDKQQVLGRLRKEKADHDGRRSALLVTIRDQIDQTLRGFNSGPTKSKFNVKTVETWLNEPHLPEEGKLSIALASLSGTEPQSIERIKPPPIFPAGHLAGLAELLAATPENEADDELDEDASLLSWVQDGLQINEGSTTCAFCKGDLDPARLRHLRQYFDREWLETRENAKAAIVEVDQFRLKLDGWEAGVPSAAVVDSTLRAEYEEVLDPVPSVVADIRSSLENLVKALNDKAANPSLSLAWGLEELPSFDAAVEAANLVLDRQFTLSQDTKAKREEMLVLAARSITGSKQDEFVAIADSVEQTALTIAALDAETAELTEQLAALKAAQNSTKEAAEQISYDLHTVYGRDHLTIGLSPDGETYVCLRDGNPAKHLSTGERNVLALSYFLRSVSAADMGGPISLVIDDPSSSLDQESVYAMTRGIFELRPPDSQLILLTHDLSLLRLFVIHYRKSWFREREDGAVVTDGLFDVQFLHMRAGRSGAVRTASIDELPRWMVRRPTEYFYLFGTLLEAATGGLDDQFLPLVPNSARRLVEAFVAHRAPKQSGDLRGAIEHLSAPRREEFIDVLRFCNEYSHGEIVQATKLPSLPTIVEQIGRTLQFVKAVDPTHFAGMCEALGFEDPFDSAIELNQ